VTVELADGEGALRCSISDDGKGFDPATTARGAGLQNMSDRIEALGGTFQVTSAPGAGTTIATSVPMHTPVSTAPG
jgi:signal transduction histidine kinase